MKLRILIVQLVSVLFFGLNAQTTIYTNDMDYVLGDAKQAFIQDEVSTTTQVENLLVGFKAMGVNGIRIPIIADGHIGNEQMLAYFHYRALQEGFEVFANPAQSSGGQLLANGVISASDPDFEPVINDSEKTQALIDAILDFDATYKCKWINPFNEDGKTGNGWSAAQISTIYKTLKSELVNAELIGSCAWGIPASIDVLKNTDISDYITISATHNLGFNHTSWTEFINLSHAADLPVWDSEVNHSRKYEDKETRIEAALAYGVDGLVLYNSWNNIDMTDGSVDDGGQTLMSLYLKPVTVNLNKMSEVKLFDLSSNTNGFSLQMVDGVQNCSISVHDLSGRSVFSVSQYSTDRLDVDTLDKGVYLLTVISGDDMQSEKVLVY